MSRPVEPQHRISAVALVVVLALTVAYLYSAVLGGSVFAQPKRVTIELTETGGLYSGSGVSYRGVRVGSVSALALAGDHVTATLRLNPDARVPSDTKAIVRRLSPAGEQYVDLQPNRDGSPFLADGARIGVAQTDVPASVAETLVVIDDLMTQVDDKALHTILTELNAAFARPDDLGRVVSASLELVQTLDAVWPEMLRLLKNSQVVLGSVADQAEELTDFAQDFRTVADWLEDFDPTLRRGLDTFPSSTRQLQRFADFIIKKFPPLLREFDTLTYVFATHDPHLRELLKQFPLGFEGLTPSFVGGRLKTNMELDINQVCSYGIVDTNPQLGIESRQPFNHDLSCPRSFPLQQRGSAWRPGPTR
ncbi:MAG TPA: MlaD family protein [Aeromicrobium sp.]|nr:MlaD family protein [Aeromicrobium sp.]